MEVPQGCSIHFFKAGVKKECELLLNLRLAQAKKEVEVLMMCSIFARSANIFH
jgi:hypothetical protein